MITALNTMEQPSNISNSSMDPQYELGALCSVLREMGLPTDSAALRDALLPFQQYIAVHKPLPELVSDFLVSKDNSRSQHTLRGYKRVLDAYADQYSFLSEENVRTFVNSELERGNAPQSVNVMLSCLKSFSKWLTLRGVLKTDVARLVEPVRAEIKAKDNQAALSSIDLKKVRQSAYEDGKNHYVGLRNKLLVSILGLCGSRIQETLNVNTDGLLKTEDDSYRVTLTGTKSGKSRFVYFPDVELVEEFLVEHSKIAQPEEKALFLNERNGRSGERRLSDVGAREIVKRVSGLTPHAFRHAAVTYLLSHGVSLTDVQQMAGHSSIGMTAAYSTDGEEGKKRCARKMRRLI